MPWRYAHSDRFGNWREPRGVGGKNSRLARAKNDQLKNVLTLCMCYKRKRINRLLVYQGISMILLKQTVLKYDSSMWSWYVLMLWQFRCFRKIAKNNYWLCRVCPSVYTEQFGSHWKDFHKIWYLSNFLKSVEKIQVLLKCFKNNPHLHEICTFTIIPRWILFRMEVF